jgi:hypothetical protein
LSSDRLLRFLTLVTVLLFVCYWVLPRGPGPHAWTRWAKWGAIGVFSAAVAYALAMTLLWVVAMSR